MIGGPLFSCHSVNIDQRKRTHVNSRKDRSTERKTRQQKETLVKRRKYTSIEGKTRQQKERHVNRRKDTSTEENKWTEERTGQQKETRQQKETTAPEWTHRQGGCLACWRLQGRFSAESSLIYIMHESLRGYCPCVWGVRPINWIYRLWRHCT